MDPTEGKEVDSATPSSSSPTSLRGSSKRKRQPKKIIIPEDETSGSSSGANNCLSLSKGARTEESYLVSSSQDSLMTTSSNILSSREGKEPDPMDIFSLFVKAAPWQAAIQTFLNQQAQDESSSSHTRPPVGSNKLKTRRQTSASIATNSSANTTDAVMDDSLMHPMLQVAFAAANTTTAALSTSAQCALVQTPRHSGENRSLIGESTIPSRSSSTGICTPTLEESSTKQSGAEGRQSLKRRLFHGSREAMKQATGYITPEERTDLNELENFANLFKKQRIKFGFTQGDVGQALGKRYGTDFSQTTISRFEALNLSYKNMCKLRPLLKEWLADAEKALAGGATLTDLLEKAPIDSQQLLQSAAGNLESSQMKKRRKRTNLDTIQKAQLDVEFALNPRPDHSKMAAIADKLELDRDVVRVWFCNRRQKMRKEDDVGTGNVSNLTPPPIHQTTVKYEPSPLPLPLIPTKSISAAAFSNGDAPKSPEGKCNGLSNEKKINNSSTGNSFTPYSSASIDLTKILLGKSN